MFCKNQRLLRLIIVLVVTAAIGASLNMMKISVFNSSMRSQRPSTRILRLSNDAINELNNGSRVSSAVRKSQSDVNENYILGYTEKKLPFVRIYDYSPCKESNAAKIQRFEYIQTWLKDKPETKSGERPKCSNATKRILWYDVWHDGIGVRNRCRKNDFSKCECRCEVDFFIFNDTQKTYEPFGGDAILFQINKLKYLGHPPLKRDGQVFVAVEREATSQSKIPLENFEYVFNWTMTFRQDSDIFYPYGRIMHRTGTPPSKNYSEIYNRKKKGIIWFVSHCRTRSKREVYAKELNEYIDLNIVGHCGADICPRHSNQCLSRYEQEYFFRFNFENTFHRDYVTEKLFENFSKDMIQIVGGSAEYDNIVPANTVIDVKDFDSPKALATYLKILMSSEERYIEYLKTKDNHYAELLDDQSQRAYCELCSMLHDPGRYRNLYYSIGDWFVS